MENKTNMDKFKEIEDNLFNLVKSCINNREFLMDKVGSVIVSRGGEDEITHIGYGGDDYYDTKKVIDVYHIRLNFENEPQIYIYPKVLDTTRKRVIIKRELTRKNNLINLFRNKKYSADVEVLEEHKTYHYILQCGGFQVNLTAEQIEELVELYYKNKDQFKKEQEMDKIKERINKYLK